MSNENKQLSRRSFLRTSAAIAGLGLTVPILAACDPNAAAPGAAPSAGNNDSSAPSEAKAITVWTGALFSDSANEALQGIFTKWADENDVELNYDISPSQQIPERTAAAIESGTPPEVIYMYETQTQFYRAQDTLMDVSDIVEPLIDIEGGMFNGPQVTVSHGGSYWGVPWQLNPWVMHARQELLDEAGLPYPSTWDELAETCAVLQDPPNLYGYGLSLGRNNDTNNNIIHTMWGFGGKLANDDGSLDFKSDGTLAALNFMINMYNDELIPPGAISWDDAGNNKAYQSRQCAFALNPSSIYAWLVTNDADLEADTMLYNVPDGPAGSFGMTDTYAFGIFKESAAPELGKEALTNLMQPENYVTYIEAGEGRAVPVYKNFMDLEFWSQYPKYSEYGNLAEVGRGLAWSGSPTAASGDVLEARTLADMVQRCVVDEQDPEASMNQAYDEMVEMYQKHDLA